MHLTLQQLIHKTCCLKGSFTLKSGIVTDRYFDKYLLESDPRLLEQVSLCMIEMIPESASALVGLEIGGIPIATMLSHYTDVPLTIMRKKPKSYGTAKQLEGCCVYGKEVVIVEDVITSGSSVIEAFTSLQSIGAKAIHVVAVVDRNLGGVENIRLDCGIECTVVYTVPHG